MPRVSAIQPTDEELLARVADGDRDAFGDLYQRYARAVLGLAIRRLGDRGRAEDAVQEAFASVWRAARSYKRDRGPVAPWLYAVARNAIADRGRARTEPPAEPIDIAVRRARPTRAGRAVLGRLPRPPGDGGAARRRSEPSSSSRTGAGCRRARSRDYLAIPLGTVKTRTRSGLRRLSGALEEELGES